MQDVKELPDKYFEELGKPKPGKPFDLIDEYRFYMARSQLVSGSLLDVGAYFGDFLKLAREDGRKICGTEVNEARKKVANEMLGEDVVTVDFRYGVLRGFSNCSVDNVVCTEVIEHVPDHKQAVRELCRVARKRVIITVPFKETVQHVLCIHCCKYTPYSGHLHSYDMDSFRDLVPETWEIMRQEPFAGRWPRYLAQRLKRLHVGIAIPLLRFVDLLTSGKGRWLLIVLRRPDE